jgi:hypothetical protein
MVRVMEIARDALPLKIKYSIIFSRHLSTTLSKFVLKDNIFFMLFSLFHFFNWFNNHIFLFKILFILLFEHIFNNS